MGIVKEDTELVAVRALGINAVIVKQHRASSGINYQISIRPGAGSRAHIQGGCIMTGKGNAVISHDCHPPTGINGLTVSTGLITGEKHLPVLFYGDD